MLNGVSNVDTLWKEIDKYIRDCVNMFFQEAKEVNALARSKEIYEYIHARVVLVALVVYWSDYKMWMYITDS